MNPREVIKTVSKDLYSVWRVTEGCKVRWYVQFPKGVLAFKTRKEAQHIAESNKEIKEALSNQKVLSNFEQWLSEL